MSVFIEYFFFRYHEHDVEDDVANCIDDQEYKCQQVRKNISSNKFIRFTIILKEIFINVISIFN